MKNALALSAAAVALLITSLPAHAAFVVDLTQEVIGGVPEVVANGGGTIDLTGLKFSVNTGEITAMVPFISEITTGTSPASVSNYTGVTGPASFGSGGETLASSSSGDHVGLLDDLGILAVPQGYVSGHALSDSATYDNATFASLGVTPGTYKWTWGTGDHADSFTLQIGVPEPSTWAMMLVGFGLVGFAAMRKGKREARLAV
jgi:hypothetical protein